MAMMAIVRAQASAPPRRLALLAYSNAGIERPGYGVEEASATVLDDLSTCGNIGPPFKPKSHGSLVARVRLALCLRRARQRLATVG